MGVLDASLFTQATVIVSGRIQYKNFSAAGREVMSGADVFITGNVLGEANVIRLSSKLLRNLKALIHKCNGSAMAF